MLESSLIKLQALRNATLLKRDSNTDFFAVNSVNYSKTPVLCRGSKNGWF